MKLKKTFITFGIATMLAGFGYGCFATSGAAGKSGVGNNLKLSDLTAYPACPVTKFYTAEGAILSVDSSGIEIKLLNEETPLYAEKYKVPEFLVRLYNKATGISKEDYAKLKDSINTRVSKLEEMLKEKKGQSLKFHVTFCEKLNAYLCDSVEIDGKAYYYIDPQ